MLAPLWVAALHSLSEPLVCDTVDVSLSTHDDRMLQYGRSGVPLCSLGDQCLARVYPGNQGPLHVYMPPSVQKLVDDGGQAPPVPASSTCLLCIRRGARGSKRVPWVATEAEPGRLVIVVIVCNIRCIFMIVRS